MYRVYPILHSNWNDNGNNNYDGWKNIHYASDCEKKNIQAEAEEKSNSDKKAAKKKESKKEVEDLVGDSAEETQEDQKVEEMDDDDLFADDLFE